MSPDESPRAAKNTNPSIPAGGEPPRPTYYRTFRSDVTDPDVLKYIADKPKRRAEERARYDADLQPILQELKRIGVNATSLDQFVPHMADALLGVERLKFPVTAEVASILLKWLSLVSEYRVKQSIIQVLQQAQEPYDGRPMAECFDGDRDDEHLRFPIAAAFTETRPTGIDEWLIERARQRRFGSDRGMLLLAVARLIPPETALPILRQALDDLPGFAAVALAEIGGPEEVELLESRREQPRTWERKEIEKAIKKIRKRTEREAKRLAKPNRKKRGE